MRQAPRFRQNQSQNQTAELTINSRYNCFALNAGNCSILENFDCQTCKFYKSKQDYARERLEHIDDEADFMGYSDIVKDRLKQHFENMCSPSL